MAFMADTFNITIMTPDKRVLDGAVRSLVAPGELGYLEILANHASLMTTLVPGRITLKDLSGTQSVIDSRAGGFMEVSGNHAILLLDAA